MSNYIRVLDMYNGSEIAKIENVINPLISEQINDVYNFEFETVYDQVSKFATGGNIIEIENDYFRITSTTKDISGNYQVHAEHISFALTMAYFEDYVEDGIEGTAIDMLTPMLTRMGWTIGTVAYTGVDYYKPSSGTSVKRQIIDIANLFGLEIIWNKYTVSLVEKRGNQTPIKLELGKNLLSVTETYDLTQEIPEPNIDVDVLDLSQLEGYENYREIGLGDAVNVIASHIDINATHRVFYRQYDPFSKATVNIQIGRVPREFTDYERDREEKEDETVKNYWLEEFTVDSTDILELENIDATDSGTGANLEVNSIPETISIKAKEQYKKYYIAVNVEQNGESIAFILNDEIIDGAITINNIFTKDFTSGAVKVSLSDKPYNIEGANVRSYFVNLSLSEDAKKGIEYYIESETVKVGSGGAVFTFTVPYDAVVSVVPGVGKVDQEETVTAHCSLMEDESGMFTGVSVEVKGLIAGSVDVSVQAVVQEGIEEVEPIG